jgi:hypothetical protein
LRGREAVEQYVRFFLIVDFASLILFSLFHPQPPFFDGAVIQCVFPPLPSFPLKSLTFSSLQENQRRSNGLFPLLVPTL